jgi:hypothetical protein
MMEIIQSILSIAALIISIISYVIVWRISRNQQPLRHIIKSPRRPFKTHSPDATDAFALAMSDWGREDSRNRRTATQKKEGER